jgi:hypothetical protein
VFRIPTRLKACTSEDYCNKEGLLDDLDLYDWLLVDVFLFAQVVAEGWALAMNSECDQSGELVSQLAS